MAGARPPADADADKLVRCIRIVLANHRHLDRLVCEAFAILRKRRLPPPPPTESTRLFHVPEDETSEPTMPFDAVIDIVCDIFAKLGLPVDREAVVRWAAATATTFCLSRSDTENISADHIIVIVDWALRLLAEEHVRASMSGFYNRSFLVGFDYDTSFWTSGLALTGPMVHGIYGNLWLHAKRRQGERRASEEFRSGGSMGGQSVQSVIYSIPKNHCKLPPELLSERLRMLINMERLPFVLPLLEAYEDLDTIHLVYQRLGSQSVRLMDKVFDDMNNQREDSDNDAFCEVSVQQIVRNLMFMLRRAHELGLVHGCLRMGNCYLDDRDSLDSLRILEFGLFQLFEVPAAHVPSVVMVPLVVDPREPLPPYHRDFQCIAEIAYLMLSGVPVCSFDSSAEQRRRHFGRGAVSFAGRGFAKTSERAKIFISDMLRPPQFHGKQMLPPSQDAGLRLTHRFLTGEVTVDMEEALDVVVMRAYDRWRHSIRAQLELCKFVADKVTVAVLDGAFREWLQVNMDSEGKVGWPVVEEALGQVGLTTECLKKFNRAFGDGNSRSVHAPDFVDLLCAWRRKRVRELLWQVFVRTKSRDGTCSTEVFVDNFTMGVAHVWSKPSSIAEVLFPAGCKEKEPVGGGLDAMTQDSTLQRQALDFIGSVGAVSYLNLISRLDSL